MDQEEQQRYDRAHARVQAIKGFYIHASAYALVNIALFVINVLVGGGWWFYWPLLGWGIGLGVHALAVFGFSGGGPWGREWEERKTRELMDQDRRRQPVFSPCSLMPSQDHGTANQLQRFQQVAECLESMEPSELPLSRRLAKFS